MTPKEYLAFAAKRAKVREEQQKRDQEQQMRNAQLRVKNFFSLMEQHDMDFVKGVPITSDSETEAKFVQKFIEDEGWAVSWVGKVPDGEGMRDYYRIIVMMPDSMVTTNHKNVVCSFLH